MTAAVPRGDESILPGDRIIVIGRPDGAGWSRLMARGQQPWTTSSRRRATDRHRPRSRP
jgi:hypothetical protein